MKTKTKQVKTHQTNILYSEKKIKKKGNLKGKLWEVFSQFIRLRDADDRGYVRCISCGKTGFWKDLQAGHYVPKNSGNFFYFNEDDVHAQCYGCNVGKDGNLIYYRKGLIEKIGLEEVEKLEYQGEIGVREGLNATCKYSNEDYADLIRVYKDKLNDLKKHKSWVRQ